MEKFKIGDKVKIPKTKLNKVEGIKSSAIIIRATKSFQNYLFIVGIEGKDILVLSTRNNRSGDYFYKTEVELYNNENINYEIY